MWLSCFCAVLVFAGFGTEPQSPEPRAPLSLSARVHGRGQAGILAVQVIAGEEAPHTQVELALPEGVRLVGVGRVAEADIVAGKPYHFRFPLRAKEPGAYIIGVKAMAGSESYRFGKSVSVAWIAQD